MKPEIKFNWIEVKNDKMRNFRDRIWFIKFWAQFVKNNPDEVWSKGQAELIDSQFQSSKSFYDNLEKTERGKKISEELKRLRWKVKTVEKKDDKLLLRRKS